MNYRHGFHAGNFADVVKHALLALCLTHLRRKDAAFRVIDTHAGSGRYDLTSSEAVRGGEWPSGIGRVWSHDFAPKTAARVAPYLDAVRAINPDGPLRVYPGSPDLIRHLLRPQDRLIACEAEPGAARALTAALRGDARAKAIAIDGWTALQAYIPPKERRGLVLIDPPFEAPDEFMRLADALLTAHRKWSGGTFFAWYPLKDDTATAGFYRRIAKSGHPDMLRIEIARKVAADGKLRGSGQLIINPPYTLEGDAQILLGALAPLFWPDAQADIRVEALKARAA
jgi:23S rRNA (adenine2030-N6)-methyltransferase